MLREFPSELSTKGISVTSNKGKNKMKPVGLKMAKATMKATDYPRISKKGPVYVCKK